jgi:hypothetical protein
MSIHDVMKRISEYFVDGGEGGNYVLTRNDSNYIGGDSILIQDALAFNASTGKLGTIVNAKGPVAESQGYDLLGKPVTAQFSLNLDTVQVTLSWSISGQPQQNATIVLKLYRDDPSLGAGASSFYAENASDNANYSLNIQLL